MAFPVKTLPESNIFLLTDIDIIISMDSDYDDELYGETDSGNESPEEEESDGQDDFGMDPGFEDEPAGSSSQKIEDEYYFEVSSD